MKTAGKVVFVNLLLIAFAIVPTELIFGSWFSQEPTLYRFARYRHRNIVLTGELLGNQDRLVYTRDRYGFRGLEGALDEVFILTVGGSTTDQKYVGDGLTFQDRLQTNFQRGGRKVDIVNAGIDGQSTFGHLQNFPHWFETLPELRPKYILYYIGVNDFYNLEKRKQYDRVYDEIRGNLAAYVKDRSALFLALRIIGNVIRPPQVAHHFNSPSPYSNPDLHTTERRYEAFRDEAIGRSLAGLEARVGKLAAASRKIGAEPIFVTQRSRLWHRSGGRLVGVAKWTADEFSPALAGYPEMTGVDIFHLERLQAESILRACAAADAVCIDLADEIQFDPDLDFYDAVHTTPSGSARIGDFLYEKLRALP